MSPLDRSRPPAPGPVRPYRFPPSERTVLPNGLRLWVAPVRALPVVTLSLVLPAGGRAEPEQRAGLATWTSELLESGTASRTAAEIAEEVEGMGVSVQVHSSWDAVRVEITGLRERMEQSAELLADLVRHPSFPPKEAERVRDERLADIAQDRAEPGGLADEAILAAVFAPGVPYHRLLAGTPETVRRLRRDDALGLHAARYRPAGATLLAVGDLGPEEAAEIALRVMGDWEGGAQPLPPLAVRAGAGEGKVVLIDRPDAAQTELRAGHVGVSRDNPDYFAVRVMNAILGGSFASRLNLNLRERHGYTYGVSSHWAMRSEPGPFLISTATETEGTGAAVRETLMEVNRIRDEQVDDSELRDAASYLAGVFPIQLQTTAGVAGRLAELAVYGLPDDYFNRYRERLLAVSADDVLQVARQYLHPARLALVAVGPGEALCPELEALGHGPVRVVSDVEEI